jgi:hypothetical protein
MDLTFDTLSAATGTGTTEQPRHHSLELALHRMGFRPRPDRHPQPRWSCTWPRQRPDDAVGDWQPL